MESTTPYLDSPTSSRSPSPSPSQTPHTSPSSTDSAPVIKPLPPVPASSPPYTDDEPYRDEPTAHPTYHHHDSLPPTPTEETIPLAHFLRHSHPLYRIESPLYPAESPPSYSVAVRQTHWNRDTLIQYIPDGDEESGGVVVERPDDVRHGVEKVVAMFVVAVALLVVSGVLAWSVL